MPLLRMVSGKEFEGWARAFTTGWLAVPGTLGRTERQHSSPVSVPPVPGCLADRPYADGGWRNGPDASAARSRPELTTSSNQAV
jgi:hypothetical protein